MNPLFITVIVYGGELLQFLSSFLKGQDWHVCPTSANVPNIQADVLTLPSSGLAV